MSIEIFQLGLSTDAEWCPEHPCITRVHLDKLNLGEYQDNRLAELRIYMSDVPSKSNADFVGFFSRRYNTKFAPCMPLEMLASRLAVQPPAPNEVVVAAPIVDWYRATTVDHPGMEKYLRELMVLTNIPMDRIAFWSNQFFCHKQVYLAFEAWFRQWFGVFHAKYGYNYSYSGCEPWPGRHAGVLYERFTMAYFSSRSDLVINKIPKIEP